VAQDSVFLAEDGDVVEISSDGVEFAGDVPPVSFTSTDRRRRGPGVLRDRQLLAEEGVIVVIVTVDSRTGHVLTGRR